MLLKYDKTVTSLCKTKCLLQPPGLSLSTGDYCEHSVLLKNLEPHHLFHAFTLPIKLHQRALEQSLAQKSILLDFCVAFEASFLLLTCCVVSCHHRTVVPPAITALKACHHPVTGVWIVRTGFTSETHRQHCSIQESIPVSTGLPTNKFPWLCLPW